jgi:hypothetical protein
MIFYNLAFYKIMNIEYRVIISFFQIFGMEVGNFQSFWQSWEVIHSCLHKAKYYGCN